LKLCYNKLFGDDIYEQCYIEVADSDEVVLSANREGLLLLVEEIILMCERGQSGAHYHLDEAGMASKCDKPLIIQLIKAPWQDDC
jgi:hypothetical protein